jgi:hypothetical protein
MRISPFHSSGPISLDATDIFLRRLIFRMSHGLTNMAVAGPTSTADAETADISSINRWILMGIFYCANNISVGTRT